MVPQRPARALHSVLGTILAAVLVLVPGAPGALAAVRDDVERVSVSGFERLRWVHAVWAASSGTDLAVPAAAGTVRLALPRELHSLAVDWTGMLLDAGAETTAGSGTTTTGLRMDGPELVVDLPAVRAAVRGAAAAPPDELRLHVRDPGTGDDVLDATLVLRLTDGPAGDVRRTLPLPLGDALVDRHQHRGGVVLGRPGSRVELAAEPGFWHTLWAVGADHQSTGAVVDLREATEVSADGSRLTVRLPGTPTGATSLRVEARGLDRREHTVWVGLHRPSSDPVEAYVQAVYADLFDRLPDHRGLWDWTAALRSGTRYGAVADGITSSREYRGGLIQDAYVRYLARGADPQGLVGWLDAMDRGLPIQGMEAGFLASPEHYARAGGTDEAWVHALYGDVLGRTPAPAEVAGWLPAVRSAGRTAVARSVLYSTEHLTTVVDGLYGWLLGRELDPTGQREWVRALQAGHRSEGIVAGIIASDEYRARVATR